MLEGKAPGQDGRVAGNRGNRPELLHRRVVDAEEETVLDGMVVCDLPSGAPARGGAARRWEDRKLPFRQEPFPPPRQQLAGEGVPDDSHDCPRRGRPGRVPCLRAFIASGLLLALAQPNTSPGQAAGDPGQVAVRIAILGTRGIPARYGGFETLADELSRRLAARGHEVTVYCRSHYAGEDADPPLPPRVRRIVLPSVRRKYLDTIVHALISSIHAARERYDAVLYCNAITAAVCWIPRAWSGARVLLNVDGLERNRRKWSAVGRAAYLVSERLSCRMPDAVVADAEVIRRYYREEFGVEPYLIPYGGRPPPTAGRAALDRLGLSPGGYFLYVSRLEPENNALAVVEAYRAAPGELPLVVVGDAPYAAGYIARVKAAADARVLFPGAIYGEGYRELLFHCRA